LRYLVVGHCTDGPDAVCARAAERGRMLPEGLVYLDNWIVDDDRLARCFQLMETDDPALFDLWLEHWRELGEFEVLPVISSAETEGGAT
jgi:hypothetical protein